MTTIQPTSSPEMSVESDSVYDEFRAFQHYKQMLAHFKLSPGNGVPQPLAREAQMHGPVPAAATATHTPTDGSMATGHKWGSNLANEGYLASADVRGTGYLGQQFGSIANPAPVGLAAFALTTFVLSMHNAGAGVNATGPNGVVNGLALFYGGVVQFAAGMWEMRTGNTFGAVAFASYGGFWMSYAALFVNAFGFLGGYADDPLQLQHSLGIYLLGWTIFSFMMLVASHRTTGALFSLFFILVITFVLLTIGHWVNSVSCIQAGGAFGILDAVIAWYCAMAAMLTPSNSVFRLPVLELAPVWSAWGKGNSQRAEEARSTATGAKQLQSADQV